MKRNRKHQRSTIKRNNLPTKTIYQRHSSRVSKKKVGLFIAEHPLNGIIQEEMMKIALKVGQEAAARLPINKRTLQDMFKRYDRILILTKLASHALMMPIDSAGGSSTTESLAKPQQSHVELAQAIALPDHP